MVGGRGGGLSFSRASVFFGLSLYSKFGKQRPGSDKKQDKRTSWFDLMDIKLADGLVLLAEFCPGRLMGRPGDQSRSS